MADSTSGKDSDGAGIEYTLGRARASVDAKVMCIVKKGVTV